DEDAKDILQRNRPDLVPLQERRVDEDVDDDDDPHDDDSQQRDPRLDVLEPERHHTGASSHQAGQHVTDEEGAQQERRQQNEVGGVGEFEVQLVLIPVEVERQPQVPGEQKESNSTARQAQRRAVLGSGTDGAAVRGKEVDQDEHHQHLQVTEERRQ